MFCAANPARCITTWMGIQCQILEKAFTLRQSPVNGKLQAIEFSGMGTCKISYVYPGTCSVSVICHSMLVVHFENDSFLISLSDRGLINFIKSSRLYMYLLLNISFEHSAQHI